MFKIYDGRTEFWQWDLDRKIIVSDPVIDEVHFCNKTDNCSLVVEVYELNGQRVANVPNILLQNAWPINVFGYCGKCFTKQYAKFKVNARSKPADYVYTETEVKSYEDLKVRIEAVEEGVKAKLDKELTVLSNSFTNYLYAKQADGRNFLVAIGGNAAPYSIPQRTATGTLRGATPVNEADLTPKKYVDDELAKKLTIPSEAGKTKAVIGYNANATPDSPRTFTIGSYISGKGHQGSIAVYHTNGCLRSPTPINDEDVATKGYVDTAVASSGGGTKLWKHTGSWAIDYGDGDIRDYKVVVYANTKDELIIKDDYSGLLIGIQQVIENIIGQPLKWNNRDGTEFEYLNPNNMGYMVIYSDTDYINFKEDIEEV